MNTFVNAAVATPDSFTENGALTFSSSLNTNVDLFFRVGASRGKVAEVTKLFKQAVKEDAGLATRIALWARDARGGAGEREIFRSIVQVLPGIVQICLIPKIVELGRWDDLGVLVDSNDDLVSFAASQHWKTAVLDGHGLAAKWAPRKGDLAVKLRKLWGMTPKTYRKTIVAASNTVEQKMCAKQWNDIEFAHVPSVASARYNAAFYRNALDSYTAYKNALVKGETKINASAIFPHDVVRGVLTGSAVDTDIVDCQWKALPDFLGGKNSDILVMSDVSGSMMCALSGAIRPIDVSVALGLYVSERQPGPFKDLVLTFHSQPTFHKVRGVGITDRIANLSRASWGGSTDINAAFKTILKTAKDAEVPAEDMPKILLILSDMEFDSCCYSGANYGQPTTNFQAAKKLYEEAGYELPKIVFWNLNSRTANVPVRYNQAGVALISGFSPAILKSILAAEEFTPVQIMLDTVMNDRYRVPGATA